MVFLERAINPWRLLKHMGGDKFSCFAVVFPMWSAVNNQEAQLHRSVPYNANLFSAFQKKTVKLPEQIESLFH